jgi:cyclopropane fatty-acyl-phospholipid synthase-like methyltransferase
LYQHDPDPWNFASSAYELDRYEHILRALSHTRYKRAFEPGCSIGVLTERLASICDFVEAMDISPIAVERACQRCSNLTNVHIVCATMPDSIPAGEFDLIVFSEIGYYFNESQLASLIGRLITQTSSGGTFLAAHWLGSSPDHLLSGDRVHQVISGEEGLSLEHSERHADFRLDRWVRR